MNIWVNGCFDILHKGHLVLLTYAKYYSPELLVFPFPIVTNNTLYVGIDSDARVKRLKGDKRPINDVGARMDMLKALKVVDEVFIFDTDSDLRYWIEILNIDYMIVGDQYKDKEVIGHEKSKYGVVYFPVGNESTTKVIEKIKNL